MIGGILWVKLSNQSCLEVVFNLDARTHGSSHSNTFDVGAFEAAWFLGVQAAQKCAGVVLQFVRTKRHLTDAQVNDGLFIDTVFNFTSFGFGDGSRHVCCYGARLWIWHQTTRTEQASIFTKLWHVLWRCHQNVKVQLFFVQLLQEFFITNDVGASFFGSGVLFFWCKYCDAYVFTGTVRQ